MGILRAASGETVMREYGYFMDKQVVLLSKISNTEYR